MMRDLAWAVVLTLSLHAACTARGVPAWSYETLVKESDLIVIVVPTASRDAKAEDHVKPLKEVSNSVGVVTTFQILATLKGTAPGKQLELKHYRETPVKGGFTGNGPQFIAFGEIKSAEAKPGEENSSTHKILFLRRLPNGEFEFATGQVDPRFSVKDLSQTPMHWPDETATK